jgi:hypothetical protein
LRSANLGSILLLLVDDGSQPRDLVDELAVAELCLIAQRLRSSLGVDRVRGGTLRLVCGCLVRAREHVTVRLHIFHGGANLSVGPSLAPGRLSGPWTGRLEAKFTHRISGSQQVSGI